MTQRVYMDFNATMPLRPEARAAMIEALDVIGNASSVHADGRRVRAILERARGQVAEAFGALSADIVFTSGATEAASLGLQGWDPIGAEIEHDAVLAWIQADLQVDSDGKVTVETPGETALQAANSETGILQELPEGLGFVDASQLAGKLPFAFDWTEAKRAILSAHKFGGPKGAGALILKPGTEVCVQMRGGGQEMGRRAGTENAAAIAGFGAAAACAARDIADGVWEAVAQRRDLLEAALEAEAPELISIGKKERRLPNTACFAVTGWKGETQVMQMDLAGFSISAGSACSSGKVRSSRVLQAMGYDPFTSRSAIRVSIGPATTDEDVLAFAEAWASEYRRFRQKAA
ncbi:MAG: aminotransferase class V-fold PLP-dependent enzyme [Pseudomonadota bacterium]